MDFLLCWYLKCLFYATSVHDAAELQQRVENASETITRRAGILEYV
jgi:hypothetical protein